MSNIWGAVQQIKYRGQVQFLSASPEFGDICHPFLTGSFRFELSLKDIFCSESHISPVRPVFLQAHRRLQAELLHQFSHRFATELKTSFLKLTAASFTSNECFINCTFRCQIMSNIWGAVQAPYPAHTDRIKLCFVCHQPFITRIIYFISIR